MTVKRELQTYCEICECVWQMFARRSHYEKVIKGTGCELCTCLDPYLQLFSAISLKPCDMFVSVSAPPTHCDNSFVGVSNHFVFQLRTYKDPNGFVVCHSVVLNYYFRFISKQLFCASTKRWYARSFW